MRDWERKLSNYKGNTWFFSAHLLALFLAKQLQFFLMARVLGLIIGLIIGLSIGKLSLIGNKVAVSFFRCFL